MNSYEQRTRNDREGLQWINRFGTLRTAELGRYVWPNDTYARTRADRIARGWLQRGLVIARTLPDGAGRTLVLSEAGARLLRSDGIKANSGKDIGETKAGRWIAPADWKHDLMTAGVLLSMYERNYEIHTEREIRTANPTLTKFPDGLIRHPDEPDSVYWLEVENARKSGRPMESLANALCIVSDGQCRAVSGMKPNHCMVAYVPKATDERHYQLNHRIRVTRAIERTATRNVTVNWAACLMRGAGVLMTEIEAELIKASPADRLLKVMLAIDWVETSEGAFASHYGDRRFYIWEDEYGRWYCQLNDGIPLTAESKADGLRGCALLLSEDLAQHP